MKPLIKKIISWYKAKRDELKEKNGKYVPSIVFQHIPLPEYYCILRRVKKNERKAVQAYRTHKHEYYRLGKTCRVGGTFKEPPSIPDVNSGEFDALSECGDIMAVYVGHDHKIILSVLIKTSISVLPRHPDLMLTVTELSVVSDVLYLTKRNLTAIRHTREHMKI